MMKRIVVLGIISLVLGILTIMLWWAHHATGEQSLGLFAYLSGMLATGVFLVWIALLSLRLHKSPISPKVLAALRDALNPVIEPEPGVRYKVAVGLSELDMEQSSHHYKHDQLDNILISALNPKIERDRRVRSKVAEGLTEVELEPFTHHEHNQLEDALLDDMAQAFK